MSNISLAKEVAEELISSKWESLETVLDQMGLDDSLSEDTDFTVAIDDFALRCTVCDWWCEPSVINDHPDTSEFICDDCLDGLSEE